MSTRARVALIGMSTAVLCALLAAGAWAQRQKDATSAWDRISVFDERLSPRDIADPEDAVDSKLDKDTAWAWRAFKAHAGGKWEGSIDRRNAKLAFASGSGLAWVPGNGNSLKSVDVASYLAGKSELDLVALEAMARDFLASFKPLFGYDGASLVLSPGRSGLIEGYLWFVDFDVLVDGIPVEGARIFFRGNNGNLVQLGAERVPPSNLHAPKFKLDRNEALAAVSAFVGGLSDMTDVFLDPGSQHLLPVGAANAGAGEGFAFGQGYELMPVWQFVIRRKDVSGTWRASVDATKGAVVEFRDINEYASVTGGVYPISVYYNNETVMAMPFETVTPASLTTNSAGLYTWTSGTQTGALTGTYVTISDTCGGIADSSDASGNIAHGTSTGTDCSKPTGKTSTHAAREQFYHINRAKEKGRGYLPTNSWLQQQLTVNVNGTTYTCNAFWNGTTLNFFRKAATTCANTGELADVALHEYGHGLDSNDGNGSSPDGGTGETYGDWTAILQTHSSCVGMGFLSSACGGYGWPCVGSPACTGVRDIDYAKHNPATPATPANFNSVRCGTATCVGPCNRECHCESAPSSQANWDMAVRDLTAAPLSLSAGAAWAIADRLWYLTRPTATGAFTCVAAGGSGGCNAGTLYQVYLIADDDDGNLANGTPHACAIFAAFKRHDIACWTAGDARNSCTNGCVPPSSPSLSGVAVNNTVSLSWTSTSGLYDVYRNEAGCSAGFTRIANDLTATTYVDNAVANGTTYYYQVIAHQATPINGACASGPSNCVTVTPFSCTPPSAPAGLTASVGGSNQINLSWGTVAGATEYRVLRSLTAGGPYTRVGIATAPTTAYSDTSVSGGVTYYYVVRSFNACESVNSSEASATASGACTIPPSFAGVASVAAPSSANCTLTPSWAAATASCGGPISYSVYRSTINGFIPVVGNRIATGVTGTTYSDSAGLVSGTTYYYVVRATDASNGIEDANLVQRSGSPLGLVTYGNWSAGAETGDPAMTLNTPWAIKTNYRRTGTSSYGVNSTVNSYPTNACGDLVTPTLLLNPSAAATLSFYHIYSFEAGWDGGRIEIQDTAVGTWTVLTPTGGYPSTITSAGNACGWPTSTPVYTGNSTGYPAFIAATVNIPASYQGKAVKVRWVFSSDGAASGSGSRPGWYVDDIVITQAGTPTACGTAPSNVSFLTATATSAQVKVEWLNPTDASYASTVVRYKAGSAPSGPNDATATLLVDDAGAYSGQHRTATTPSSLVNGTTYYFAAYVRNAAGTYSSGKTVVATPFATTGKVKWAYSTGAATLTPPGIWPGAIGSGMVLAVSNDRALHATNPSNTGGDWPTSWKPLAMNGPAQDRPLMVPMTIGAATRVVFVSSQDGHVYCVNADTGAQIWQSALLGEIVQASPSAIFTAYGGAYDLLFVGTRNASTGNSMFALNPTTGATVWQFTNSAAQGGDNLAIGIISSMPYVDYTNRRLYFTSRARGGGSNNTAWCLDFTNASATRRWAVATGDSDASPMLFLPTGATASRVYVATTGGSVYALDPLTGANVWSAPYATADGAVKAWVMPQFGSNQLYLSTTNTVRCLLDNNTAVALKWSVTLPGASVTPSIPVYLNGANVLLVGSSDGKVYLLDTTANPPPTTNSVTLSAVSTAGAGTPTFDVVNNAYYVGTQAGIVYGITYP